MKIYLIYHSHPIIKIKELIYNYIISIKKVRDNLDIDMEGEKK
jgi:hypothetical protein